MCEVLIRVADKINADFYLNTKCTKRGDVIVVRPDGWAWGKDELALPFWRIVKLPNISESEASAFLAPELDIDPLHPSKTLQRRVARFDVDNLTIPQAVRNFIADDTRVAPAITFNVGVAAFRALRVTRTPIIDPAVIGGAANVIG